MSKHICIISHHFPPTNFMGSWRQYYRAKYLDKMGYKVSIITLHEENILVDKSKSSFINKEKLFSKTDLIRVPYNNSVGFNLIQKLVFKIKINPKKKLIKKIFAQISFLILPINYKYRMRLFPSEISNHLASFPDYIIASGDPWNIHEHGRELANFYNTKYIAEYRDPWNYYDNSYQIKGFNTFNKNFWSQIKSKISLKREQKINKNANGIISVSKSWTKNASIVTGTTKSKTITNGFEPGEFQLIKPVNYNKFTLSYTGHIYPFQEIYLFINGLNLFIDNNPKIKKNIQVLFFGSLNSHGFEKRLPQIKALDKYGLIKCTKRSSKNESIKVQKSSHILLYFTHLETKGVYSGKIFEYLGANKPIMISPGDNDILDELINQTQSGNSCSSIEEVSSFIENLYFNWENKGKKYYTPNRSVIESYSYKNKTKELISFLNSL